MKMTAMTTNTIYCDGSTLNNGQPGVKKSGIGAVLIVGGQRHTISRAVEEQDNHRCEAKAVALSLIKALILAPEIANEPVTLYTDSKDFEKKWYGRYGYSDYLWITLREVVGYFTKLTMVCIAGEEVKTKHPLHQEADTLASLGARSLPVVRELKPAAKKSKDSYTLTYSVNGSTKHYPVTARHMREAWCNATLQVPKEAEWVTLELGDGRKR